MSYNAQVFRAADYGGAAGIATSSTVILTLYPKSEAMFASGTTILWRFAAG